MAHEKKNQTTNSTTGEVKDTAGHKKQDQHSNADWGKGRKGSK